MNGVRVTGIDAQCSQRVLWQYFSDACDQKNAVVDVFYPLLNNDAVVMFKNMSVTTQMLTRNHAKWTVLPLPNQVFSKHCVWLDKSLGKLLKTQVVQLEYLKNLGQVDIQEDKGTDEVVLTGQPHQIEWAWRFLSDLQDKQQQMPNTPYSGNKGVAGSTQSNKDMLIFGIKDYGSSIEMSQKSPSSKSGTKMTTAAGGMYMAEKQISGPRSLPQNTSSRPQENVLFQTDEFFKKKSSDKMVSFDDDVEYAAKITDFGLSEKQGDFRSGNTQDNANRSQKVPVGQLTANKQSETNSSRSVGRTTHTDPSKTEFDVDDASSKSEMSFPSLGFQSSGQLNDLNGRKGDGFQSIHSDQAQVLDDKDIDGKGDLPPLKYPTVTTGGTSDENQYDLLPRNTIELSRKHFDVGERLKLKIYVDDLTKARTCAVVNASNWELKNVGGVAGALARAAGPEMTVECDKLFYRYGGLWTAQVVRTKAYGRLSHLTCVLHTVGPVFVAGQEKRGIYELAQTFYNCMDYAEKINLQSLAFPFISTGIYGMPIEDSILALVTALKVYSHKRYSNLSTLEEIHFVNNDINVVCEAILFTEFRIQDETTDSCLKRMEEGIRQFGRYVYPFCYQYLPATETTKPAGNALKKQQTSVESTDGKDGQHVSTEQHARHKPASQPNSPQPQSLPTTYTRQNSGSQSSSVYQTSSFGLSYPDPHKVKHMSSDTAQAGDSKGQHRSHKESGQPPDSPQPQSLPVLKLREDQSPACSQAENTAKASQDDSSSSSKIKGKSNMPTSHQHSPSNSVSRQEDVSEKSDSQEQAEALSPEPQQPVTKQSSTTETEKVFEGFEENVSGDGMLDSIGSDSAASTSDASDHEHSADICPVCLDVVQEPKTLPCGHLFCTTCVDRALAVSFRCPKCQQSTGIPTGTQPSNGDMSFFFSDDQHLPGYEGCGMIIIDYVIPAGIQEDYHPNPGQPYKSIRRTAYLPNSREGHEVLLMLKKAFDHRLIFTIGESASSGQKGVVTWSDITHKTNMTGGPDKFGYPDPDYLMLVKEELKAKGITAP